MLELSLLGRADPQLIQGEEQGRHLLYSPLQQAAGGSHKPYQRNH